LACSHCVCKQVLVFFRTGGKKNWIWRSPLSSSIPMTVFRVHLTPYAIIILSVPTTGSGDFIVQKVSYLKPDRAPLGHNSFWPSARAPTFEQHTNGTPSSSSSSVNRRFINHLYQHEGKLFRSFWEFSILVPTNSTYLFSFINRSYNEFLSLLFFFYIFCTGLVHYIAFGRRGVRWNQRPADET